MKKRGIFFSIDALLAFTIIIVIILIAVPLIKISKYETPISRDILLSLSSIKIGEINNAYIQSLVASQVLDANKTALDQIGILTITNETLAKNLANIILQDIDVKENIGIWYGNKLIFSSNNSAYENASNIFTERYIVSGLGGLNGTGILSGYSARGYLSSTYRTKYFYFGGYIGDGNITSIIEYYGNITSAQLEIAINNNFTLYINNLSTGNYQESQSEFTPKNYDLTPHLSKFNSGKNSVELKGDKLYVAGGFIKITYDANITYPQQTVKQYLPGINGLINIYDGIHVPSDLTNLNITLDLDSSYITFLNIGNTTVFNRTTNGREIINLNNTYLLSKLGNYNSLSNKTTPIRLGLENISFNTTTKVDVISVTDLSGSMSGNCPFGYQNNLSITPCKINDAKNATKLLIDIILGTNNNRVGLAGFERWAKKPDFHNLSSSSNSLKKIVNETWNADGTTCICCGIIKAIRCFDNQTFFDNFNGQTAGTNPIGWVVSEPSGSFINVTSQSLEGDRGVRVTRNTANPSMSHVFAPEEDDITINFMINHSTGSGRARIEIEGIDSFGSTYQDYIILKMYNGQIRNIDTAITPYNLNSIYNISVQTVPSTSRFNLYVNNVLVGNNLQTYANRTNVARVNFLTETSAINYTIDKVQIYLNKQLCDGINEPNRTRTMIVMSDGDANKVCGLDPVQDWDNDGQTTNDPHDHAIQAACDAKNKQNITVHAVGFDITPGSIAETTLQQVATCGGGNYYLSNITQLTQIYQQIANLILATYLEQTLNTVSGNLNTKLYPNSFIELLYTPIQNPFGLIISLEQQFTNTTQGVFQTYANSTVLDAQTTSYSGARWTEKVKLNNNTVYDINKYGSSYTKLGDPYSILLPIASVIAQNAVTLTTGVAPTNITVGSASNKIIYTLAKNFSSFSPILAAAQGCNWSLQFDDGTNITAIIPPTYSGPNQCYFPSNGGFTHDPNDAFQVAVYNLLLQLDLDGNNLIDPKFTEQALQIDLSQVTGIPFTWYSEVQIRVWN
ncbi:MAG: hypothetical protein AABY16_02600 [Nanoarchaeota archaeon]